MVKVLYVQYANPAAYPPLEHSSQILANNGWQVLVLGIGLLGTESIRFPARPEIEVQLLKYCPPGWRQKLHFFWFASWVWFTALRWRPQWIYASDPLSCPAASVLSFFSRCHLIYHEHDSPGFVSSRFMRFVLWTRRQVAQRAAFCVLPNESRGAVFKESTRTTRPVLIVWNCPARSDGAKRTSKPGESLVATYHGSIVPARVPFSLIQALALTRYRVVLRIIGYETIGHRGYIDSLKDEAQRLNVTGRVEFFPPMPRAAVLDHAREAHVGISFVPKKAEDINERYMVGASNKVFEYLACGAAALVPDSDEWSRIFVQPGYALACDPEDSASIAAVLNRFAENIPATIKMGDRGRQRILAEWNYETQFLKVQEKMITSAELNA